MPCRMRPPKPVRMKYGSLIVVVFAPILALGQSQSEFDKYEKYDSRGNLIESVGLHPDGSLAETFYSEYDSSNRLVRSYSIMAGGNDKEWINIFTYDRKGRLIIREWYPSERMILYQREVYRYDRKGNRTQVLRYNSEGTVILMETWRYRHGALVEHTVNPPEPEPIRCE